MIIYGKAEVYSICNKCDERIHTYYSDMEDIPYQQYHLCNNCATAEKLLEIPQKEDLLTEQVKEIMSEKAKRENISVRYDLLVPEFLHELARLADHGAGKYGDRNWQQSRLIGDKSPLNHLHEHLNAFQSGKDHDFFKEKRGHLVSVAFNAMMEWWYESNFPNEL